MSRRLRIVWASAMTAIIAAASAFLGVTLTYKVEHGSFAYVGSNYLEWETDRVVHPFVVGYTTRVAISIRNPGPWRVTLDGVSLTELPDVAVDSIAVTPADPRLCCMPEYAEPFHPVTFGPQAEVSVWLDLRVTSERQHYDPCGGLGFDRVEVRYSVLGMHRTQDLALRTELVFREPCPTP